MSERSGEALAPEAGALRLVLASGSPRRREMLEAQELRFEVRVADIDETPRPGEPADDYVRRLARDKADAVAADLEGTTSHLVIAADTIVEVDGELLGKPTSAEDARRMVGRLAERDHRVCTGVAVRTDGRSAAGVEASTVRFGPMSPDEVSWYVESGEPMDKAGGYAVQGLAAPFIVAIEGCYHNIKGLPLWRLRRLLVDLDIDWRDLPRTKR